MRIFDLRNEEGELHGFEISNVLISRARACKIAASIPGVTVVRAERSWFADDVFCILRIGTRVVEIEEPFGDNSRYYVGARPAGWCPELASVREAFASEPAIRIPWLHRNRHAV